MKLLTTLLTASLLLLTACNEHIIQIPAGFIAKKLEPTGWNKTTIDAGQIDIGPTNNDGTSTSLVLLQINSITEKEQFTDNNGIVFGKTPIVVDVYIRMIVSQNDTMRDLIFSTINAKPNQDRTSIISTQSVYIETAKPKIRNTIRAVLQKYNDPDTVRKNLQYFNQLLTTEIAKQIKDANIPLEILDVSISNIMQNQTINQAENNLNAAKAEIETIKQLGEQLQKNPQYLEKYKIDKQLEMVQTAKTNVTIIISDSKSPINLK